MRLEPPSWWYGSRPVDRIKSDLLLPAAWLYGLAANARFKLVTPYRSHLPVICIGNFTAGGAGKTPLSLALAAILRDMGRAPAFLTRGYGGRTAGPHWADASRDPAAQVGDEALLLARAAPTLVAQDRPSGARAIEESGADVIVMDDGFQNPSLMKDLSFVAIDAGAGIGNARVLPAGPLRAPLGAQLSRADALVLIGEGHCDGLPFHFAEKPLLKADIVPSDDAAWLRGASVLAFAGIGRPAKFFATLERLGARIAEAAPFPDHHLYTEREAAALLAKAERLGAALVTTEKDWVRLGGTAPALMTLRRSARVLPVRLDLKETSETALRALLSSALAKFAATQS